jgi:hypothetical protein
VAWEDRERNKCRDVRAQLAAGRMSRWWSSHGGLVLHAWWCSSLLHAPGVRPEPVLERYTAQQIAAVTPRSRLCGWCVYQADA